jgi:hypothetical protein
MTGFPSLTEGSTRITVGLGEYREISSTLV